MAHSTSTLWTQLRQTATSGALWQALAHNYATQHLPWQAAYCARQALRCDASLLPALQALGIHHWQDAHKGDAQLGRTQVPDAPEHLAHWRQQLAREPGDWLTCLYLARLQEIVTPTDANIAPHMAQAHVLEPVAGESWHWLGVWRLNAGDAQGAATALAQLLHLRPMRYGSMMYLGEALLRTHQIDAAEKAFARASLSNNPDFLLTLANKVFTYNYWQEAIAVLKKALDLRPNSLPLWLALGKIHWEVYELTQAQACYHQVLALDPGNSEVTLQLAGLHGRMGDAKKHLHAVQTEYTQRADPHSRLASSVAMVSLYQDDMTAAEVAALHRTLCAPIAAALPPKTDFANLRTTKRKLRIGWVTGDLHRQHPVNIFILPVLQRLDHSRFEVCIYHTGTMHDGYTHQARACADRWLEAATLDDATLQGAIVADEVDILLDLAGHTAGHRLGVFALRAAPVQATFLGYPHSTGLDRIDWLIGDATVSPAAHASLFSEGIAQLPHSVFCWAPVDEYPLPPTRKADSPVVFGSFNNAMKLSPSTLALWAQVLHAVPHAQLLLKAPSLRDAAVQQRFAALFEAQGIARSRLIFRGPSGLADMMQEYADIDIALDPTPYNGGTTTLQALWMGVPVVCLEGNNFVSRMGASFMRTLERTEWIASDAAHYVHIASTLADNAQALRLQRAHMRARMHASPLCDIATYVHHFETLLCKMWSHHCHGDTARLI